MLLIWFAIFAVYVIVAGAILLIDEIIGKSGAKSYLMPLALIFIGVILLHQYFPK